MTPIPPAIKLRDIKMGQEFIESCGCMSIKLRALEDAHETHAPGREGYECLAEVIGGTSDGEEVPYFEAFETYGHGLKLYAFR